MPLTVRLITLLFLVSLILNGCANLAQQSAGISEMAQPPVTAKATGKHYPGKFIWHDLLTPDAHLAGNFYQKLFGWQIEYQGNYAVVSNGDKRIAGILQLKPSADTVHPKSGVWLPSVSVEDIDTAVSKVKANGGTVLKGPLDMEKRGRAVLISDPQRTDLVLLNAKGGDPLDSEAAVGDWLWNEIWTDEPKKIEAFYQAVLGYDEVNASQGYDVFIRNGKWRAGIRHLQGKDEHMPWVPVVRVENPEAIAARVEVLGGVVWVAPGEAPSNGDNALIADPTGALLLIQKWPSSSTEVK